MSVAAAQQIDKSVFLGYKLPIGTIEKEEYQLRNRDEVLGKFLEGIHGREHSLWPDPFFTPQENGQWQGLLANQDSLVIGSTLLVMHEHTGRRNGGWLWGNHNGPEPQFKLRAGADFGLGWRFGHGVLVGQSIRTTVDDMWYTTTAYVHLPFGHPCRGFCAPRVRPSRTVSRRLRIEPARLTPLWEEALTATQSLIALSAKLRKVASLAEGQARLTPSYWPTVKIEMPLDAAGQLNPQQTILEFCHGERAFREFTNFNLQHPKLLDDLHNRLAA